MRPPKENLLPCIGVDLLHHYCNVPARYRVPARRGHIHLALCGKEGVYAGDGHAATCLRCIRSWMTW